jgi:hypothetical protein
MGAQAFDGRWGDNVERMKLCQESSSPVFAQQCVIALKDGFAWWTGEQVFDDRWGVYDVNLRLEFAGRTLRCASSRLHAEDVRKKRDGLKLCTLARRTPNPRFKTQCTLI